MPAKKRNTPKKLVKVNTRLFDCDVLELQRRAKAKFMPWQQLLRLFLHEALEKEEGEQL
jgi:predicted DNA binding CopG/RHH family protein